MQTHVRVFFGTRARSPEPVRRRGPDTEHRGPSRKARYRKTRTRGMQDRCPTFGVDSAPVPGTRFQVPGTRDLEPGTRRLSSKSPSTGHARFDSKTEPLPGGESHRRFIPKPPHPDLASPTDIPDNKTEILALLGGISWSLSVKSEAF